MASRPGSMYITAVFRLEKIARAMLIIDRWSRRGWALSRFSIVRDWNWGWNWGRSAAPHSEIQLIIVLAIETHYRG